MTTVTTGMVIGTEGSEPGGVWEKPDADLITHAPTDLRLALNVIEAAATEHHYNGVWIDGTPRCACGKDAEQCPVRTALDAFEAAP